jgi:hypothetical protein
MHTNENQNIDNHASLGILWKALSVQPYNNEMQWKN